MSAWTTASRKACRAASAIDATRARVGERARLTFGLGAHGLDDDVPGRLLTLELG